MGTKKTSLFLIASLVLVIFAVWCTARYRFYVYAVCWHCVNGAYAHVAGNRVRLPLLWWEEKDSDHYDTYLLKRALNTSVLLPPQIKVGPLLAGALRGSDEDERKSMEQLVYASNEGADNGSISAASSSLVTLNGKNMHVYCKQTDISVLGRVLESNLFCLSKGVNYFFSYDGSRAHEKEAESVLSSIEPAQSK
jgi:hypothetical protein